MRAALLSLALLAAAAASVDAARRLPAAKPNTKRPTRRPTGGNGNAGTNVTVAPTPFIGRPTLSPSQPPITDFPTEGTSEERPYRPRPRPCPTGKSGKGSKGSKGSKKSSWRSSSSSDYSGDSYDGYRADCSSSKSSKSSSKSSKSSSSSSKSSKSSWSSSSSSSDSSSSRSYGRGYSSRKRQMKNRNLRARAAERRM